MYILVNYRGDITLKIIGRKRETDTLQICLDSGRPEFAVVYGRRRVGKTYLIRKYFNNGFSFYATGLAKEKTRGQLRGFHESLQRYGCEEKKIPSDWFEAFSRLRDLLSKPDIYREPLSGRRVVFLDEVPWMDTARSDFQSALDYFWNSWGSAQEDFLLIVCGSATSWIIDNLLMSTGGFYNRITRRIQLLPFSLLECEELLAANGIMMPRSQIIECYMTFGGIPYYLNLLDGRLSLAQNLEELCFQPYGALKNEYDVLFSSLFRNAGKHLEIIQVLAETKEGATRKEISERAAIPSGSGLTKCLRELEQCGFIREYRNFTKPSNEAFYQLIDPFTLFHLHIMAGGKTSSWLEFINSPGYHAWRGNAFEIVCLNHIRQIKTVLGISGIGTEEYAWKSTRSSPGAQIDLLIDRKDGMINLCEMKFSNDLYEISDEEYRKLLNRLTVFQKETGTKKAAHITLITANGLKRNKYAGIVQNLITGDELFL